MRSAFAIILFALLTTSAFAADRTQLFGVWGTPEQCARLPLKPGGTKLAEPFEIDRDWLKHGRFGCKLTWGPVAETEDGLFTIAQAQCGEDAVQGYRVGMVLAGEELTLRWAFPLANGPLKRCPGG